MWVKSIKAATRHPLEKIGLLDNLKVKNYVKNSKKAENFVYKTNRDQNYHQNFVYNRHLLVKNAKITNKSIPSLAYKLSQ